MTTPIVWTIAGSDSGGGAGIQADIKTFESLGVHGCSVITALTAQNSKEVSLVNFCNEELLHAQINTLEKDLQPKAIKLGMLGATHTIAIVAQFLKSYSGFVVCDPVTISSTGNALSHPECKEAFIKEIIPNVDLLTPNIPEAEFLLNCKIQTPQEIKSAAKKLIELGCKAVLIKGGHGLDDFCQDYFTDGEDGFWLTIERRQHDNTHGSGCTLSSAIAAAIARDYCLADALIIAKSYVSEGIRKATKIGTGVGPVTHHGWPTEQTDLPWLTATAEAGQRRPKFPRCLPHELGFYLIVDSTTWLERMIPVGVKTFQLRIKNLTGDALENEIKKGIDLCKKHNATLFINDYWELAIKHGAYGVHLGQGDLCDADIEAIEKAGLRLGISTHCYYEVARAHAYQPSYIACGPIYETTAKIMPFAPQGLDNLSKWRKLLNYPLVAIGGISLERGPKVLATGVESIAVISAVLSAPDPEAAARDFLNLNSR